MGQFWYLLLGITLLSGVVTSGRPPNILLIMADDIGIEGIGCYGGESYATPHLDRLAKEGVRFTHAYSQPLCTPTRVEIMTGKYNHRNWRAFGILDPGARTFGHMMQEAGYRTCIAGKWQLQSYDPPDFPGGKARRGTGMHPKDAGFERYSLHHSLHTEDKGSRYANPTFLRDGVLHEKVAGAYGEDLSVEYIAEFMTEHRDEPMFVYYPMSLPHGPMNPTPISDAWQDPERRLEDGVEHFPDMVVYMDMIVGRLIGHLDQLGLRENTLVLFYSDNGTHQMVVSEFNGQQVTGGKGLPLQTGIRVPLIASWPGRIGSGAVHDDLVDASDFFPTLAELAGFEIPESWGIEGHGFADALYGREDRQVRDSCFFWYDPRPGWDKEQFSRSIFALDHRYKLFSDGRLFAIDGLGLKEDLIKAGTEDKKAKAARAKLQGVLDTMMQPPMSDAAMVEVDAFGNLTEELADGWQRLFNGRDLAGWSVKYPPDERSETFWKVADGVIEGDTRGVGKHDYNWLVSEGEYGDFQLRLKFQVFSDVSGNSGIQFRSRFGETGDGTKTPWMHGPQVDIHPPSPLRTGLIYDETWETRRWIHPSLTDWSMVPEKAPLAAHETRLIYADRDPTAWNTLEVICEGTHVKTFVNGLLVTNFDGAGVLDDVAHRKHQVGLKGHFALQIHRNDKTRIRFKDIWIRE